MSDPDPHPRETLCAAPQADDACATQIIEPRDVPLGGLRAMNVRRTLPQRSRSLIGAWCFLDHYGPDDVAATGGMNVPAHPHTGLQTVSWLFSGEIEHRDSAGFHALVRPGELNLMTAGRGISHSERSTPGTTVLHGAQLWVALPSATRDGGKGFEHYAPPMLEGADEAGRRWRAQVFLGSLLGDASPVTTHTPLLGAEIRLDPGTALEFAVDPAFEHGVLVDTGAVSVTAVPAVPELPDAGEEGGRTAGPPTGIAKDRLAYLPAGAGTVRLTAGADEGARLLVLGGEPLGEQIVMWWNFIGRDHDEIARARADWQAQIAVAGVGDVTPAGAAAAADATDPDLERFGLPQGEPEPPLPAPPLPIARLVPRRQ